MAKLRLKLAGIEIIMSKIISVTIDNVEFKKSVYYSQSSSRVIQIFYNFIKRNPDEITLIIYKLHNSDDHVYFMHLKNGKIHNINGKACYFKFNSIETEYTLDRNGGYYIDGEKIEYNQWLKNSRRIKLEKLEKL